MPSGTYAFDARLCSLVAARIADERLPVLFPAIIRPRHGTDELCQVCDLRIDRFRIEYGVTDPRDGYELRFHLMCHRVWQVECRHLLAQAHCGTFDWPTTRRSSIRPEGMALFSGESGQREPAHLADPVYRPRPARAAGS